MNEKPKLYIASCSFGKDSIATILLALENNEPLDRVVFAEVMFDHEKGISGEIPEHIEWVYNVAIPRLEGMGVKVDVVKSKWDYVSLCNKVLKKGNNAGCKYGVQNCAPCYANSDIKVAPIRTYLSKLRKDYQIVQYVGIAIDEPIRLERLKGTNKVSLLQKYGYTEQMAKNKCMLNDLLSPIYSMGYSRGGCWFCFNASIELYIHIRKNYPKYWELLRELYYQTGNEYFKYDKTFEQVEKEMDLKEWENKHQLKLF